MLRRLTGFTLLPLLSLVTPFLLLPVVARVAGAAGWSSVVAGQAVGTFGATVTFWGWNVVGPVAVARATDAGARTALYAASLRTRLLLLLPVVPVAALVTTVVAQPGYRLVGASMAVATSLLGLSPAWFGIGVGQPWLLFWYDTLPRVAAAVLAVPLVLLTRAVWTYPVILVVATLLGLVAFQRRHAPGADWSPLPLHRPVGELREQGGTAGVNLVATAYASTPAPIATSSFPGVVASGLSSADAVYRLGLFSVVAVGNAFQGWTLEPGLPHARDRVRRHRAALAAHTGLGLAGAVFLVGFGPVVTRVLFGDAVAASREVCAGYAVSFLLISTSTPFVRNLLIPAGRTRLVLLWTAASAVVGVGVMVGAAVADWLAGVAWGMAASEAALLFGLAGPAWRELRSSSPATVRVREGENPPSRGRREPPSAPRGTA